MSLRNVAFGSMLLSSVGMIRLIAQFFVIPLLSRLLSPEDYGLIAMAMPIILFTMLFTDAGLGQSLIREKQYNDAQWSSGFWFLGMAGTLITFLIILIAPFISYIFDEPALTNIIMALSIVVLLQTICSIPETLLRREENFKAISAADFISIFASIVCAALTALFGWGVWALVVQQLVLYAVKTIMLYYITSYRPRLSFKPDLIKPHILFGRDVIGVRLIWFFTQACDVFVVGKILGTVLLGYYSMAFLFIRLPFRMITGPLTYVLYTYIAPRGDDTHFMKSSFLFLTRIIAFFLIPVLFMIAACAADFFTLFLSGKWAIVGNLFMIAAPAAALQSVSSLKSIYCMALDRPGVNMRMAGEYLLLFMILLCTMSPFGLHYAVAAYSLSVFLYLPRSMALFLPLIKCTHREFMQVFYMPYLLGIVGMVFYSIWHIYFYSGNMIFAVFIAVITGIILLLVLGMAQYRTLKNAYNEMGLSF